MLEEKSKDVLSLYPMESCSLNNNITMIIKMTQVKDDSECDLSRSRGACRVAGIGDSLSLHSEQCAGSTCRSSAGKLLTKVTQLAHGKGRIRT